MHLDADGKPDLETICQQAQAFAQTAQAAVYVTQSLVCQNAYGEVEYIAKGDSCAYAMYLAIAFRAQELVQRIQAKEIYIPNDNQKPEESNDTMSPSKKPRASSMPAFVWYHPAVSRLPINIRLVSG